MFINLDRLILIINNYLYNELNNYSRSIEILPIICDFKNDIFNNS